MTTEMKLTEGIKGLAQKFAKYSTKKLKKHQFYLNNDVVSDYEFITMVQSINQSEYYENFPSDTMDRVLLIEYLILTEIIFVANGVNFKSLLKKKS